MSYIPDPTNLLEPKDSRGVGSAAGEFRALKRRVYEAFSAIDNQNTAIAELRTEVIGLIDQDIEANAEELIGDIVPKFRLGTNGALHGDLFNWLYCDGRYLGPDATDTSHPGAQPQIYHSSNKYMKLFQHIWTTLARMRVMEYAASPDGLGRTDPDSSIMVWSWSVGDGWHLTPMPAPGDVADWEAAWNDAEGAWAVPIPDLRGATIRGENAMNGTDALPDEGNPIESLNTKSDYGRIVGSFQHASLLAGDRDQDSVSGVSNILTSREKLGWDKLAADITITRVDGDATLIEGTGAPYPAWRRSDDHPETDTTLILQVPQIDKTGTIGNKTDGDLAAKIVQSGLLPYHVGAARVDNLSFPFYIRYQ